MALSFELSIGQLVSLCDYQITQSNNPELKKIN